MKRGEGQPTVNMSLKESVSFSVGFQMPLKCFISEIRGNFNFRVDFSGPYVSQRTEEQTARQFLVVLKGRGFWDPAGVFDKAFPTFTVPE